MRFDTEKWIKPKEFNPNETLFGDKFLERIGEKVPLYAIIQLENKKKVTKYISEIDFVSSVKKKG